MTEKRELDSLVFSPTVPDAMQALTASHHSV